MSRVILILLAFFVACEASAAEKPQMIFHNGKWWIVKSAEPAEHPPQKRVVDLSADYKRFGREVEQIVLKMNEVAVGRTEKADQRALAFLLRDCNGAVANANWEKAQSIAESMKVYLARGSAVAGDAERRKTALARAEAEMRHQEEMEQRAAILRQLQINAALMHAYGW